jgi:ribosomal protein S18 acetylase RimI-like enzyme
LQTQVIQSSSRGEVLADMGQIDQVDSSKPLTTAKDLGTPRVAREGSTEGTTKIGNVLIDDHGVARIFGAEQQAGLVQMLPLTASDEQDFLRMALDHFVELNSDFVPQADWKEHYFPNIMANPQYFLRWIVRDGKRAGFILFGLEKHRFLLRLTGVIYELYVLPEFRRRGVAKACVLEAIRELRAHAPSKIQLEVTEGLVAASALWRSVGFQKVTDRYVLSGSKP